MNYQRVFSGNTELIDGQREEWYKSLKGERIEWEDLAAAHSTGELLEQLDTVPLYEYIVNYLRCIWEDAGKDTVYENVIRLLTERISQEFSKNGMPEEKCRPSHIREMLTTEWSREWDNFENAASRRIFELALGLQLPAQDVEQLLQKAVKRAGFNYYDPEELFVWCALQFAPGRCYLCFEALMRDYKMIAPAKEKKEKRNFANTAEVRDQLEDVIRSNIGGRLYSSEECEPGTMDPAFEIFYPDIRRKSLPAGQRQLFSRSCSKNFWNPIRVRSCPSNPWTGAPRSTPGEFFGSNTEQTGKSGSRPELFTTLKRDGNTGRSVSCRRRRKCCRCGILWRRISRSEGRKNISSFRPRRKRQVMLERALY